MEFLTEILKSNHKVHFFLSSHQSYKDTSFIIQEQQNFHSLLLFCNMKVYGDKVLLVHF